MLEKKRGQAIVKIIATIGAVLIFVGIAWLIAKNWHQIPNAVKVLILVFSTLTAFVSGVLLRQHENEGVGRSLINLGALLYILSLFLISQIYHLATTSQHYAWLLFFAWTIILISAYFLDSPENLVLSMLTFFPWVILQYYSSIKLRLSSFEGITFSFILIFLSAGVLLYGLSVLHNSIKHKFTNIYRFWTVFYFLLIFYILSFQSFLPLISQYSFEGEAFSVFLVLFIILSFFGFIVGALFATSKVSISIKEIAGFLGVLAILFILVLSTKAGESSFGSCTVKDCYYDFKTSSECVSAPDPLSCVWDTDQSRNTQGYCRQLICLDYKTEAECNSTADKLDCIWQVNDCLQQSWDKTAYETCSKYNNQKDSCVDQPLCNWQTSYNIWNTFSKGLPTSLWFLWILNNFVFIGFIILVLWYGQFVGSTKIVNLGLFAFILEIITRYIGFWIDLRGYFAFSVLAILGGLLLILGAWLIPKWRRKLLDETKQTKQPKQKVVR